MNVSHLSMEELLAVRDGDRSEPGLATAHAHVTGCAVCQGELERLHQRTARLRALPRMTPARNQFPAVRARLQAEQRKQRIRVWAGVTGLAAAAALFITVVGTDLLRPSRLSAEAQLQNVMSQSQRLETELHDFHPEERVVNGRMAVIVIELQDKIADLDQRIDETVRLDRVRRLQAQLKLWQERVGLMNALVEVHLTKASNIGS